MGFSMLVDEADRAPMINTVLVPEGMDEAAVRRKLLDGDGIEIGGGLGALKGKVWRIGLMGASCTEENVEALLAALAAVR